MTVPAELLQLLEGDERARNISYLWDRYNNQRASKIEEWKELRDYLFATDTSTTSNSSLPWKNSTTTPKLTQIRDNLHSNYRSALFPNDRWLRWEGYTRDAAVLDKAQTIQAYMANKCRESHFRTEMSKLLYDYIDYGNAFATVKFETRYKEDVNGDKVADYIGPRLVRISPLDIVFNPLADTFKDSFKIIRSLRTIGELKAMAEEEPENQYLREALAKRDKISEVIGSYSKEDTDKAQGYLADGFGSMHEYYQSNYVEVLEFWGDMHDDNTGRYEKNKVITIIDRAHVIREEDIPSWFGHAPIYHVGWRYRPDNLWAMGPLDNLVGMQYRIDHLENLKADAMDLLVHPPLKIVGEVEEFEYAPGSEIHIDENGDVVELGKNAGNVVLAENAIQILESKMEQYAGAPSEAMGIRTPGEKTAFEVNQLQNAAGRIFQEKITTFEIELLEPSLNAMLETSARNLDVEDTVRVFDEESGATMFMSITRDDIVASGKLRPLGARHFAEQAQLMQNLTQLYSSPVGQMIAPHTSSIKMTNLVEDILKVHKYNLFQTNVAIEEQADTQRAVNGAEEELLVEDVVEVEPGV